MKLAIHTTLDYRVERPTDLLLQIEAAALPTQTVLDAHIDLSPLTNFARIAAQDGVGERLWLRANDRLQAEYRATIGVNRAVIDLHALPAVPLHQLPAETVPYLMASRYCEADLFDRIVEADFVGMEGGALVAAIRDWIEQTFCYTPGISTSVTTAMESYIRRQGICRDYTHVLIAMVRAAGIPARMASVYSPDVAPSDFHAVAEVYLDGAWQLVDATGMANADRTAIIGIGRDAADIAFLTSYGNVQLCSQSVLVTAG